MALNTEYTDIKAVKAHMPDDDFGTEYDPLFTRLITEAAREVDLYTKWWPGAFAVAADEVRYFNGVPGLKLMIDELAAAPTTVEVSEAGVIDNSANTGGTYTTWAATDYLVEPYNYDKKFIPITSLVIDVQNGTKSTWFGFRKGVKITGKFGYAVTANIPAPIKLATEIQVVRTFKRGKQAFQDAAAIPELSQIMFVKGLDPQVQDIIQRFVKGIF